MKKHYFLGTATGYTKAERASQRHARGTHDDLVALCDYLVREYSEGEGRAVVTRNGRSAIATGLKYYYALATEKPRPGVIVNGFTCHAVVQGVKAAGMEPVFADIDPNTLNFTFDTLEKAVTEDCWAIIVQNTLGNMIDMREVEKFAKKHKLVIVEDLAHCVGRIYPDGREAGKVGQVVAFSFGKEKSIDVVNGGAVVLKGSELPQIEAPQGAPGRAEVRQARWYPTWGVIYRGLSYVGLHGVFMRLLLKIGWVTRSADGVVDYKNTTMASFQAKLALERLKAKKRWQKQPLREFCFVRGRSEVLERLQRAGYYFGGFWYEKPVSPERYYKKAHFPERECPGAVWAAEHIVNLPTYYTKAELTPARKIIRQYEVAAPEEANGRKI